MVLIIVARVKLTDRWISALPPPSRGRIEHSDAICPGLYLRITSKGVKSFSVIARQGRLVRRTLGRYPRLGLADARRAAMELQRELAEAPVQVEVREEPTLAQLVDSYVDLHLRRNIKTWEQVCSMLRQEALSHLAPLPAASVSKRDVLAVLDGLVAAGTPHSANNLLKNLKALYNWAIDRDLVAANPCDRVRPPVKTTERDRVLADVELAAVWKAAGDLPAPWSSMIRMLMLTGQRRCEVSNMRWDEINGDTWVIPRERVKKDRPHAVPLTGRAAALLAAVQPAAERRGFVFSTDGGKTASSNFAKMKHTLDRLSGVTGWVLHDLRRTVRSKLAELGVSREIARKILNHEDGKIDRVYQRYEFMAEKREALERWNAGLVALASKPAGRA